MFCQLPPDNSDYFALHRRDSGRQVRDVGHAHHQVDSKDFLKDAPVHISAAMYQSHDISHLSLITDQSKPQTSPEVVCHFYQMLSDGLLLRLMFEIQSEQMRE